MWCVCVQYYSVCAMCVAFITSATGGVCVCSPTCVVCVPYLNHQSHIPSPRVMCFSYTHMCV